MIAQACALMVVTSITPSGMQGHGAFSPVLMSDEKAHTEGGFFSELALIVAGLLRLPCSFRIKWHALATSSIPSSRSIDLFQGGSDMLRLFVSATIFVIFLGLAGLPVRAQSSSDATSKSLRVAQSLSPTQPEEQRAAKSVACRKQAKEQKLSGSERRAFLKNCIRK
jgi:psiF repeat-containing protein